MAKKTATKKAPAKKTTTKKKGTTTKKPSAMSNVVKKTKSRTLEVNGEPWPRKKVGVLAGLQKLKAEVTKPQLLEVLLNEFGMNEDKVNHFCHELAEEGYIEVNLYEGDRNHYRQLTKKGAKVKLPSLAA